jgi:hypothetical protein
MCISSCRVHDSNVLAVAAFDSVMAGSYSSSAQAVGSDLLGSDKDIIIEGNTWGGATLGPIVCLRVVCLRSSGGH